LLTLVPFPLYNSPDEEICVKFWNDAEMYWVDKDVIAIVYC
jgi:hypothetical protein